tara:strand:- start:834 stop:1502 length:669 start_codon:yes stop_codon:yes gene_type:complete
LEENKHKMKKWNFKKTNKRYCKFAKKLKLYPRPSKLKNNTSDGSNQNQDHYLKMDPHSSLENIIKIHTTHLRFSPSREGLDKLGIIAKVNLRQPKFRAQGEEKAYPELIGETIQEFCKRLSAPPIIDRAIKNKSIPKIVISEEKRISHLMEGLNMLSEDPPTDDEETESNESIASKGSNEPESSEEGNVADLSDFELSDSGGSGPEEFFDDVDDTLEDSNYY